MEQTEVAGNADLRCSPCQQEWEMGQTEVAGNADLRCSLCQQEWEMGQGLPATLRRHLNGLRCSHCQKE